MQFFTLLSLVLIPLSALAAPAVEKRDAATVQKDLAAISAGIASLNDAVTAYRSSSDLAGAIKIQQGSTALQKTLDQTTTDVQNAQPFNEDDSTTIAVGFLDLDDPITNLLNNLVSKKDIFPAFTKPLVVHDLQDQKSSTDQLGAALATKLTSDLAAAEPAFIQELDDKFDAAIAAFSTKSA